MSKYEDLFGFIPFLENAVEFDVCHWNGDASSSDESSPIPCPVYTKTFMGFISALEKTDLVDRDYSLSVTKLGIIDPEKYKSCIQTATISTLRTLFTHLVRGEGYRDGIWVLSMQNGLFLELIQRLRKIEREELFIKHSDLDSILGG